MKFPFWCETGHASGTPPASGWPSATNWQGKGVGLADNWPSVKRVDLKVYADNEGGIALYEKFGFEIEGTYRRDTFRDGAYVNTYSMARLRS